MKIYSLIIHCLKDEKIIIIKAWKISKGPLKALLHTAIFNINNTKKHWTIIVVCNECNNFNTTIYLHHQHLKPFYCFEYWCWSELNQEFLILFTHRSILNNRKLYSAYWNRLIPIVSFFVNILSWKSTCVFFNFFFIIFYLYTILLGVMIQNLFDVNNINQHSDNEFDSKNSIIDVEYCCV